MKIFSEWCDSFLNTSSSTFPNTICTTGERIAHLGGRCDFARVWLRFDPANELITSIDSNPEIIISQDSNYKLIEPIEELSTSELIQFKKYILFGSLDILMSFSKQAIFNVCITIEKIEIHPIDSNASAFRLAAREATYKALECSNVFPWKKKISYVYSPGI